MILNDYLKTLDPNQIVAIGAKYGEGFLYIEKAGNTDAISKRFKDCLRNMQSGVSYKAALLTSLFINAPELTGNLDVDYPVMVKRCDLIRNTSYSLEWQREYCENFVPVLEREVLEDYDRSIDGAIVVLIEGIENGSYWLHDEYLEVYPV